MEVEGTDHANMLFFNVMHEACTAKVSNATFAQQDKRDICAMQLWLLLYWVQ